MSGPEDPPGGPPGQFDALEAASTSEDEFQDAAEAGVEELPPEHPLLQRAQAALRAQLEAAKLRLQEELREKRLGFQVQRSSGL